MAELPNSCESWQPLIDQYDWDKNIAQAIMQAESSCNTNLVGDNYPIGGLLAPSCGLFQVRTLEGRPPCEELKKAEVNVAYAYQLYKSNGWQPWTVYNTGKYYRYLK